MESEVSFVRKVFGCFLGHKWIKLGGYNNCGNGQFLQQWKCVYCGRIDKEYS